MTTISKQEMMNHFCKLQADFNNQMFQLHKRMLADFAALIDLKNTSPLNIAKEPNKDLVSASVLAQECVAIIKAKTSVSTEAKTLKASFSHIRKILGITNPKKKVQFYTKEEAKLIRDYITKHASVYAVEPRKPKTP